MSRLSRSSAANARGDRPTHRGVRPKGKRTHASELLNVELTAPKPEPQKTQQNSQTQMHEEDETVDVESYGEETSNGAINMTSQLYNNNNNNVINHNNNTIMHNKIDKTTPEDHTITSLSRTTANWDHKSRMSLSLNCTQINENAITRVTPTSSDQKIDVEYELDNERADPGQERMSDNEEEVIVDNTDDENDCGMKRKQSQPSAQRLVNGLREMKKR
jgi:hypothetical protein